VAAALHDSVAPPVTSLERVVEEWDVVVVGAGPAGSLAARQAATNGASVLLVDRDPFPRWKVCGACLGPAGQDVLRSVGLGELTEHLGAVPLATLRLSSSGSHATIPLDGNVALSRRALDTALVAEAVEAGADFRPGTSASVVSSQDQRSAAPGAIRLEHEPERLALTLRTAGERSTVGARVVVDATGLAGTLDSVRPVVASGSFMGVGAVFDHIPFEILPGNLHMVIGKEGYVGLVLDEDGSLTVGAAIGAKTGRAPAEVVNGILAQSGFPALRARPSAGWRGTPLLTRGSSEIASPRLFRIGDAAGYVEPFTGEGMGWALAAAVDSAPYVASAVERWDDRLGHEWTRVHRRGVGRAQWFCRGMAKALRRPAWTRAAIRVLAAQPGLARPLVRAGSRSARPTPHGVTR
jgi:flavin-dependent dehydrogenase